MFYLILVSEHQDSVSSDLIQDEEKDVIMSNDGKSVGLETVSVVLMVVARAVQP